MEVPDLAEHLRRDRRAMASAILKQISSRFGAIQDIAYMRMGDAEQRTLSSSNRAAAM